MIAFLKKPYPYNSFSSKDILSNLLVGCFIAFFLIVFQPFGISIWQPEHKLFKLVGFGFVSFICPIIFKIFSVVVFKRVNLEETWKVWKEILVLVLVLLFIAFGNLLYGNLIHISNFNFQQLSLALAATFLLGIFPVFANVVIKYNRFLKLNEKDAKVMESEVMEFQHRAETQTIELVQVNESKKTEQLVLISENEKDKIELNPNDLLYIESADNYSNVIFFKNQIVTKQLIRGSLKRLESQIPFQHIIRCHRSYIVNLKQIDHIKGNAQGYRIEFKMNVKDTISVSRNYSKALFVRLESLK